MRNKAQVHVFNALTRARQRLPFDLLGLDSDNGAEFINAHLIGYCEREHITFTRGRVGRKNDNAFVEQKNWSVVRRLVGYDRFDTFKQVRQLNALYERYRLYVNFFLPVTKLVCKERHTAVSNASLMRPKRPISDCSMIRSFPTQSRHRYDACTTALIPLISIATSVDWTTCWCLLHFGNILHAAPFRRSVTFSREVTRSASEFNCLPTSPIKQVLSPMPFE